MSRHIVTIPVGEVRDERELYFHGMTVVEKLSRHEIEKENSEISVTGSVASRDNVNGGSMETRLPDSRE